jgi:hypothetical protein
MIGWLILAAAVQFVAAMFAAGYADDKGRDGAVWFLIGLALGPITFIPLYFFDLPPVRTPNERAIDDIATAIAKASRKAD